MGKLGQAKSANSPYVDIMGVLAAATRERLGGYYNAITIAFVDSGPDTITDSANLFLTKMIKPGSKIRISGSTSNDGVYTVDSVVAGTITLIASDELVAEIAGDSVVITPVDEIFCKSLIIQCADDNTGSIILGDSSVLMSTRKGILVTPGNAKNYEGVKLSDIWIDVATSTDRAIVEYEEALKL